VEDELLIKRLKKKDMDAFEQTVDTYKNYVGAIVKNSISFPMENDEVEEAVAEVFFALWKMSHKLKAKKGSIKNYLGMLTRKLVMYKIRERMKERMLSEDLELAGKETPQLASLSRDTMKIIASEVDKLKSPNREIFLDFHLEEKTIHQISEDYKIPIDNVKAILIKTRKKLKKKLMKVGRSLL